MKYIFLHIPKNGGTSIKAIVEKQYEKYEIFSIPDHRRKQSLNKLKKLNFFSKIFIKIVIGGHFAFGCHSYFLRPKRVKYFVMLRHPIDRALSYYLYAKRTPEHYLYNKLNIEEITFEQFVFDDKINLEISNGQTKLIAGIEQKEVCNAVIYLRAINNLKKHFFLIGIMERFLETLFLLKKELFWSKPITYKIFNAKKNNDYSISDRVKKQLKKINEFDIEIYNEYSEKFEQSTSSINKSEFEFFKDSLV